jgi:hypothetical protein
VSRQLAAFDIGRILYSHGAPPPADPEEAEGWYYAENLAALAARHIRPHPDRPADYREPGDQVPPVFAPLASSERWPSCRAFAVGIVASVLLWVLLIGAIVGIVALFGVRQ